MGYPAGYYEGGGGMKEKIVANFEGAIPLILILVLGIFVAGKFGLINLHGLPVVGGLFPAPAIKVLCIGHCSDGVTGYLTTDEARIEGIIYQGEMSQEVIYPGALKNYDLIIVQGERFCDLPARKEIASKVSSGGKMIFIGDACIRVTNDESVYGWGLSLKDAVPATIGGTTAERETVKKQIVDGQFTIVDPFHPLFGGGVPGIKNFPFNGELVTVVPAVNSKILATILEQGGGVTGRSHFAIIEGGGFMGKTMYFAYDPGIYGEEKGRELFLNTVVYLNSGGAR